MQQEARGRWVYIPHPEEVPVTFQIGMVGNDGVLLASDRLYTQIGPGASRRTWHSDKIFIRDDKNIAYCSAGDDVAARAAQLYYESIKISVDQLDLPAWQALHLSSGNALREDEGTAQIENRSCGSLLVADLRSQAIELWYSEVKRPPVSAYKITEHYVCVGDSQNSAGFFLERYFPKDHKLPLTKLTTLAAHAVLMAGATNPTGVAGLEIVLCSHKKFTRLSQDEISSLMKRSHKLDSKLAALLGLRN